MQIKALHPDFIMPTKGTAHSAGWDLYMPTNGRVTHEPLKVPLGFAAAIPQGWVALLLPRSGAGSKGLELVNTCGVIDADYRGEWIANLQLKPGHPIREFNTGDRLLQVVLVPHYQLNFQLVDELPATARGEGGFGSTGS